MPSLSLGTPIVTAASLHCRPHLTFRVQQSICRIEMIQSLSWDCKAVKLTHSMGM